MALNEHLRPIYEKAQTSEEKIDMQADMWLVACDMWLFCKADMHVALTGIGPTHAQPALTVTEGACMPEWIEYEGPLCARTNVRATCRPTRIICSAQVCHHSLKQLCSMAYAAG